MLLMDTKTSEKLRSKHVRTLELLQKTLDENVDLRDQIGRLQKGTLHLGQGVPQSPSNRATELEDEIDRLKAEQRATTLALEEAARVRHAEFTLAVETLQKKTLRLQNEVVTLETALGQVQGKLSAEKAHWRDERAQFTEKNRRLRGELDALRDPTAESNCNQQQSEHELQRLREELVAITDSEREARGLIRDAQDRATRLQSAFDTQQQQINAQQTQIDTLQQQLASANENEAAHTRELSVLREQQRDLRSQLAQLQREASQQPESNALQQQQHASVLAQLLHVEAANEQLRSDNHTLQEQVARLHAQLHEAATRSNNAQQQHCGSSVFAVHVELKRENFQLRTQIEELKQLQKRFLLTAAKKTTMRFPAL
uniref:Uncharacterized protein n=1 Tax=Globisporangium ultimum (strain ATCC 200006 / CBS 805.95 / DAOM BR144) TaxID=431595 RepID=K3WIZ8_GLOUD